MEVIFTRSDGSVKKEIEVSPDSKLGKDREEVLMLLGLPVNTPCELVLEKTGKKLTDSSTFKEAGIQDNDKLILFPLNAFDTYQKNDSDAYQGSEQRNDIPSATQEKESPPAFNFKAFPTILMAGGMVFITAVGGLLYLQTLQQQAIISEQLEQERIQRQKTERQLEEQRVQKQKSARQLEEERNQKFVQDKFDAVAVNTQVNEGYVFLSSKSGKEFTGRVTSSEIREGGNIEKSGVAARIDWSDGQTSSILFMSNSGVRVWEAEVEYRGKWYWGANDDLLYVKMDEGAQYKFSKTRLYAKRYPEKPRRSPPEQALRNYYQTLNNYQYQSAWNSLSSKSQRSTKAHPEGYKSYIDWWTQVARIDVLSTKLVSEDGFNSTVESRLRYFTKSGREINQNLRFYFIWDTGSNRWLVNKVERL
ncbi:MAG: hypothetical protein SXA11_01215 [Cyanobacteriota bacterium]|nr:hypothetical protein [Cyanobacteriota bacterium]